MHEMRTEEILSAADCGVLGFLILAFAPSVKKKVP